MSEPKNQVDDFNDLSAKEIEEAVLGAVLIESGIINEITGDFRENLFHHNEHRLVAKAILELHIKNHPIDILTVTNWMRKTETLDKVGGPVFIASLTNRVASAANMEEHMRILQQYALGRELLDISNKTRYKIFNKNNDVFDVCEEMMTDLDEALNGLIKADVESIRDIHMSDVEQKIKIAEQGGKSGVPCGIRPIDNFTNGFQPSDLIIMAARPGMGKTAEAVTIAMNASIQYKKPVLVFSLEMSKRQLVGRMQSQLSEIDSSRIIKNQLTMDEVRKLDERCAALYHAPLYIDDTPALSIFELRAKARKMKRDHGIEMIIIDYLQLMNSGIEHRGKREEEVSMISKGVKALAKELDLPIIALSQLSRKVEERADKRPMLSDLRESGQIEADADVVIFLYRPEYYGIEIYELQGKEYRCEDLMVNIIAKHRNGELGEIPLTFVKHLTQVKDYTLINLSTIVFQKDKISTFVQDNNETSVNKGIKPNEEFDKTQGDDVPF